MVKRILVSGATGFIAGHTIARLLAKGHRVVGTVRDLTDQRKLAPLRQLPGAAERLLLVRADLLDDDPFGLHVDVDVVMHLASPYRLTVKNPQRDLVDPAVQGTLVLLRAAAKSASVRRVVLTSSFAAVSDAPDGRELTEKDWNHHSSPTRNPYFFSKAQAEREAWNFIAREKPRFDLVAINPSLVIGPAKSAVINASNQLLVDLVTGKYPAIMDLTFGIVDVRDVADAHLAAMEKPQAEGRYLCVSDRLTMADLVAQIRRLGYGQGKLPRLDCSGPFGTGLMKLLSYSQPAGVGDYLRSHLGRSLRLDNGKIIRDLGLTFYRPEESVETALADLSNWGHIPAPKANTKSH